MGITSNRVVEQYLMMRRTTFLAVLSLLFCGTAVSGFESDDGKTEKQVETRNGGKTRLHEAKANGFRFDQGSWNAAILREERRADLLASPSAPDEKSSSFLVNSKSVVNSESAQKEQGAPSRHSAMALAVQSDPSLVTISGKAVSLPRYPLSKLEQFVGTMEPGRWYPLPGHPSDVAITRQDALRISGGDKQAADRLWGWGGPIQTYNSYSGAAFDGRFVYFFGGGHHMYRGNDLTVYDLETLSWQRLYDPSDMTEETYTGKFRFIPSKGPRSVHVYDGIIYSPVTNSLYLWGWRNIDPWRFDLNVFARTKDPWQAWIRMEWPEGFKQAMQKTAQLPDGTIMVIASGRGARVVTYDPETNSYSPVRRGNGHISSLVWRDKNQSFYSVSANKYIDMHRPDGTISAERVDEFPTAFQGEAGLAGMVYDQVHDRIVFWPGQRVVWSWQPDSKEWTQYVNSEGPAPTSGHQGIYSKWFYLPQFDVFLAMGDDSGGMWAWRMPDSVSGSISVNSEKAELEEQGFACSDEIYGWTCPDLSSQIASGRVIKGVYTQCVTVSSAVDFQGAHLKTEVCGRKAGLIAKDGAVIENVTITDLSIGVNAACVRWEGGTITLRNMTCTRTDMGLLGTGERLVIEDSLFEGTHNEGRNHGHVIYASKADEVVIRNTTLRDPGNQGHVLKSGARHTVIENSTLAGGARPYSRVIDAFNGGILEILQSHLVVGSQGGNGDMIGYGAEMRQRFDDNRVIIKGGSVDCSAALTYNSLHVWPERLRPDSVIWEPETNSRCRPPV